MKADWIEYGLGNGKKTKLMKIAKLDNKRKLRKANSSILKSVKIYEIRMNVFLSSTDNLTVVRAEKFMFGFVEA